MYDKCVFDFYDWLDNRKRYFVVCWPLFLRALLSNFFFVCCYHNTKRTRTTRHCGPDSVVGVATGYGLDGPGIESRWRARFSVPVQTGPGAHSAYCTMGTGSFPGVKSGRCVTLTPHPLLVPWSWNGRAIHLLPLWAVRPVQSLSACTRVHLTFTFTFYHKTLTVLITMSTLRILVFGDVSLVSEIEIFKRYPQWNETLWIRRILQFMLLCFNVLRS